VSAGRSRTACRSCCANSRLKPPKPRNAAVAGDPEAAAWLALAREHAERAQELRGDEFVRLAEECEADILVVGTTGM
jgi:nucleotide-binding universal stress UspA family protein